MCETLVSQIRVRVTTASLLAVLTDDLAELVQEFRLVLREQFDIGRQFVAGASRNGLGRKKCVPRTFPSLLISRARILLTGGRGNNEQGK